MNDPSPYQPPGPPAFPPGSIGEPPTVKVFGIMHLVFAGIGVMGALSGLLMAVTGNPFLKLTSFSAQMSDSLEAQIAMQERINPATITTGILSLLVAIPMITAGIQLLKKRRNGLKWSNAYAWSSLAAKCVNLVLAVTIIVPAMTEMTRGMMTRAPMPGPMLNIMSYFMAGSAIGGVLVSCVYPLLALGLLNRPATKAWFASLPESDRAAGPVGQSDPS